MSPRRSQLTGRTRLRHLHEVTEAVEHEMVEERERFSRLRRADAKPRAVSAFNLFQTPEPLAARLLQIALEGRQSLGRCLEPSAGLGRIYRAIRATSAETEVVLVELAADCCRELYRETEGDSACKLVQGDFLACCADRLQTFDTIAMNPPFKMGTDIRHINHARSLLKPGGRLVSLCAAGPKQRARLQPEATQWIDLPPKSFASEGTNVNAAIVVFDN